MAVLDYAQVGHLLLMSSFPCVPACTPDAQGITYNERINVAVAVSMPDGGLITPVLKVILPQPRRPVHHPPPPPRLGRSAADAFSCCRWPLCMELHPVQPDDYASVAGSMHGCSYAAGFCDYCACVLG